MLKPGSQRAKRPGASGPRGARSGSDRPCYESLKATVMARWTLTGFPFFVAGL